VDARADFQQREPNRLTLRVGERGAHECHAPQRVEQQIRDRGAVEAQLIGAHRRRARPVGKEHELLFLDSVLHLAARAVEVFIEGALGDFGCEADVRFTTVARRGGISEGIHRVRLGARAHVRPKTIASRLIDVLPDDLLEVGGYSRVRQEVVGDLGRKVDEQVHIAIGQILRSHDRAEHRCVDDAACSQFDLVGAQTREDVCEKRHMRMSGVDGGVTSALAGVLQTRGEEGNDLYAEHALDDVGPLQLKMRAHFTENGGQGADPKARVIGNGEGMLPLTSVVRRR